VRLAAARELRFAEHAKGEAVPALAEAHHDTHPAVRQAAGVALVCLAPDEAPNHLWNALRHPDEQVRASAALSFAPRLDDKRLHGRRTIDTGVAVAALLYALRDNSPSVRRSAVTALGELSRGAPRSESGAAALRAALQDVDPEVRRLAAAAEPAGGPPPPSGDQR
jgi:HEAT repeat protein